MVKIKNSFSTSVDIIVIREVVTTLAPREEKEIAFDPAKERIEVKPST